jgi:hypothetical protein
MAATAVGDNPYWHSEGQPHHADLDAIRRICFELSSVFAASHSLAGDLEFLEDDEFENATLLELHHALSERYVLERLLQLCMLLRTYDDIMSTSAHADRYAEHVKKTAGDDVGYLDTGEISLRGACNKVIHAREIRAVYDKVEREREKDGETETKTVWYLDGDIELTGTLKGQPWEATLYVRPFLETALERIAFGWGE